MEFKGKKVFKGNKVIVDDLLSKYRKCTEKVGRVQEGAAKDVEKGWIK